LVEPDPDAMTAPDSSCSLLQSWERLSSAETEAIQSGNWRHLATVHAAIKHLLDRLESVLDGGTRLTPDSQSIIQEIAAREHANLALIGVRQHDLLSEQAALERSRWNLRRQQHSFVLPASGNWQRYS